MSSAGPAGPAGSAEASGLAKLGLERVLGLDAIPLLEPAALSEAIVEGVTSGLRVASYFGHAPAGATGPVELCLVLADDRRGGFAVGRCLVEGAGFPSVAKACPQVQLFEREIAEQFGLVPEGHPWFKPLRYRRSWTGRDAWGRASGAPILPAVGDFYRVGGEEVHEVAVGPVHAGIIEPGHFRFQCHGEEVFHLEIALGYQHRGVEEAQVGGPHKRSIHHVETLAGDTTIAHATAWCQALEALSATRRPLRAEVLRSVALELERLANHTGDLGAIAGDTGFLPTSSFCGRIRGDFLNMTALLCGNRFGRGLVVPGGTGFDLDDAAREELLQRLAAAGKDVRVAVQLLWDSSSVMARLEDTGRLSREVALELGLVGPAARASGLARDARCDQPSGIYRFSQIPVSTCDTGDVFARAYLRWLEIQQSLAFIREQLGTLPKGPVRSPSGRLAPSSLVVTLDEGWRGEVCHVVITDGAGRVARHKVVDPSFHNWPALAYALRGQEISDFPLCNKSFNLSYCGHDL